MGQKRIVLYAKALDDFKSKIEKWTQGLTHFELRESPGLEALGENTAGIKPVLILLDGRFEAAKTLEWAQMLKMTFQAPMIIFYDGKSKLNFQDLKKNGADILLHMYYDSEFVVDKILELAPWDDEGTPPLSALNPISFEDLSTEMELNFDLYVHLPSNQKSILMRRKGTALDAHVIEKAKSLHQNLYFKKSELKSFLEYSRTALSLKDSHLSMSVTDKILKARVQIQQLILNFFDQESTDFKSGKAIYEACEKIVQEFGLKEWKTKEQVLEALTLFSGRPRSFYNDVIGMCVLSAGFAFLLEKKPEQVLELALAGLLHNVGLAFMVHPQLDPVIENLSEEDRKDYLNYPEKSVTAVKGRKVPLPPKVTDLILQHRENAAGGGFPKGTTTDNHEALARITQLAYVFMDLTQLQNNKPRHTLQGALQHLQDEVMKGTSKIDGATLLSIKKILK